MQHVYIQKDYKKMEKEKLPSETPQQRMKHPFWIWESIQMIPQVLEQCLESSVEEQSKKITAEMMKRDIDKLVFLGTGSSYFATIAEKYFFDTMTTMQSFTYVTSVFRNYPPKFIDEKTAVFFHSHSGKTEGDDEVVRFAQEKGAYTVGVTDIDNSPLAAAVDDVYIGPGGPKREMPASRTYATALFRMMLLGVNLGKAMSDGNGFEEYEQALRKMPDQVKTFMQAYELLADKNVASLQDVTSFFCIASGPNLSTADECALALSQCGGIPAQCFEVDNFLHGPIQTLTPSMGVVAIAAPGPHQERILRVAKAAKTIGAKVALVMPEDTECNLDVDVRIDLPRGIPELLTPVFYMIPLWQTAYHFGLLGKGGHPDRLSMDKPEFIEAFSHLIYKNKWMTNK